MSFLNNNFTPIGGTSRRGRAPTHWSYKSAVDALADVLVPGYFDEIGTRVLPGDFIDVFLTDGKAFLTVDSTLLRPPTVVIDTAVFTPGAGIIDVTVENPVGLIYFEGADSIDDSWRAMVSQSPDRLAFSKFQPLIEIGITLDEAKVASIEGNPIYTSGNAYFASVSNDARANMALPLGIAGDMTGRVIEWDGFMWNNFVDQWVEKGFFEDSFFSDRGIFRRMNVIDTDPNDPSRHPPQPAEGTSLGSRNTQFDGLGAEILSFNDKFGFFGQLVEMIHGPDADVIDQLTCIKVDSTPLGVPYELSWVSGTNYAVDDIVVNTGNRFLCNTAGVQVGGFLANIALWDLVGYVTGPVVTTSDVLAVNQLLVGNGGVDIITDPLLTFSNGRLGINAPLTDSIFHTIEDNNFTLANAGWTIEQEGSGDALLHFKRAQFNWTIGIDSTHFRIHDSSSLTIPSSLNILRVTGFTGVNVMPLTLLHITSIDPDTVPIMTTEVMGTNGAVFRGFVGTQNPEGVINGNPGDIYHRVNGITSAKFIFKGATAGVNGWEEVGNVLAPVNLLPTQVVTGSGGKEAKSEFGLTFDDTIATAVNNGNSLTVSAEDLDPLAITFNNDGTQFYFVGAGNASIYEYALSTAFVISSDTFTQSFSVGTQDIDPRGLAFNADGSKLYMAGRDTDSVYQYALSTNFDISTAVVIGGGFSIATQDTSVSGIAFNTSGSKMYLVGQSSNSVHEYDLSTNFDSSTAVFLQSFSIATQDQTPRDIYFTANGLVMLICGTMNDLILSYNLLVAFDISTASFRSSLDVTGIDVGPSGIALNNDETKLYYMSAVPDIVHEFDLNPFFNIDAPTTAVAKTDEIPSLSLKSLVNPGEVGFRTGNRTPEGNVIGKGGDVYYSPMGELSNTYESRSPTPDTKWFKRSLNPPKIIEIFNSLDLDDLAIGEIITITEDTTFQIKSDIITNKRFVTSDFVRLTFSGGFNNNAILTYEGSGDFISGGAFFQTYGALSLNSASIGTMLNMTGAFPVVNIRETFITGWTNLGSITGGQWFGANCLHTDCLSGYTIINPSLINIVNYVQFGTELNTPFITIKGNNPTYTGSFTDITGLSLGNEGSLFDINSDLPDSSITKISRSSVAVKGSLFKQTTESSIPITSVADGSPATGTITAMADNGAGGTTISSTTTYFESEQVTHSGTTNYNGFFKIFNVVAGVSYDIALAFTADDATGSIDSVRLTLALTGGHGTVATNTLKIIDTNFYNGFKTALNVVTNDVTVNGTFISTNTGVLERELSVDQTDRRVSGSNNFMINDSRAIASAHVNDNSTANGAIVNNTFTDMVFGTVGAALIASSTMERWRLIDELNCTFEYIGVEPFDGKITFDFTEESSGGTVDFRHKWQHDIGAGFVDLDDPVESLVAVSSDAESVTKTFPLNAKFGDRIKPQITRNSGTSGITTTYGTVYVN